jgi:radical SAM protein with 4Fe4S-binding SPASM domain
LWGGEPLLYREWNSLIEILHKNPRECVICTNGLLINKRIDSIIGLPISPNFLISLDGFKYEHEFLRGKGTFNSVVENIRLIIEKKRKNLFHGSISINCVINDKNVGKLFEFASFCEELGVDALFYCFPWHISSETAKKMDLCCSTHFPFIDLAKKGKNSWYSFGYHLDLEYYEDLMRQIDKLESKSWKIHLRFNPKMEEFEIKDYLQGNDKPARNRNRCLAISNRMDVLADGSVSTCKHFPELNVGNLNHHTVLELWRSNKYNHIREVVNENLMPVCANCVLLYQNGR